eukprot:s23_g58.t1
MLYCVWLFCDARGGDVPPEPEAGDEHASKKARVCVVAGIEYEHEDDHNYTSFTNAELDNLEEFDIGLTSEDTLALGKVLPGQRDGSQLWFESVSGFLREQLNFRHCDAYPSLLGNKEFWILLHVDDMLLLAKQQYFDKKLLPNLTGRYKVSVQCMKQPGDSLEFLKRIHTMVDDETIHVQQNPRHFEKLFEVVGISNAMHAQKVPCHELMNEVDDIPLLSA